VSNRANAAIAPQFLDEGPGSSRPFAMCRLSVV